MKKALICAASAVIVLNGAVILSSRESAAVDVTLPVMDAAPPATVEEIVTGVCTFGGCPVSTTATEPTEAPEPITEPEPVPLTPEEPEEPVWEATETVEASADAWYSPDWFCEMGEIYWGGWRWTWYSERVLPGEGLHIPGRCTDWQGYVRDEDGYICLASDVLDYGTVIDTPFGGPGKVYDDGVGDDGTVDVYVGW